MPNLRGYVCDLFQTPGVAASVNLDHIKVGGRGGRADGCLACRWKMPVPYFHSLFFTKLTLLQVHYHTSHPRLNYFAIVPVGGPEWWREPHDRAQRFAKQ